MQPALQKIVYTKNELTWMADLGGGFSVLQLAWPGTDVVHQLFLKEHRVRRADPSHPEGRTLFVLNLPLGGADVLSAILGHFGEVQTVTASTYRTMVEGQLQVSR
jgi:hypothetical protein